MARERIDLVIPTTDAEVRAFTRPRTRLPGRLFLPHQAVVDLCQDKYRLNVALRARGVPVPLTYSREQPARARENLRPPAAHSPVCAACGAEAGRRARSP